MNLLDKLATRKQPILACLLQPGDGKLPGRQADIYAEEGVDIVEVSLPCAHPYLDGAVVTQSMRRALHAGMTQSRMERGLCSVRRSNPSLAIVLMGYRNLRLSRVRANPETYGNIDGILQMGSASFLRRGAVILSEPQAIYRIGYVSNHVGPGEIESARRAGGYVMLQAANGKTGTRRGFDLSNEAKIARLREAGIPIPILLGFGISTPAHARLAVQCGADGVIVGSACTVRAMAGAARLARFVSDLRAALDAA